MSDIPNRITEYLCHVIHGDCVEAMRGMEPESVDLVVADPPYNIGVDYGSGRHADLRGDYGEWCMSWIGLCARLLGPHGSL